MNVRSLWAHMKAEGIIALRSTVWGKLISATK